MSIVFFIFALLAYAVLYLPVYLPFLLGFVLRGPDRRELRIALRIASAVSIIVLLLRPRPTRPEFGDDVAGNMRGSQHYFTHEFWPDVAWIWGTGLVCLLAAVAVASYFRGRRHRSTHEHVTHNAA